MMDAHMKTHALRTPYRSPSPGSRDPLLREQVRGMPVTCIADDLTIVSNATRCFHRISRCRCHMSHEALLRWQPGCGSGSQCTVIAHCTASEHLNRVHEKRQGGGGGSASIMGLNAEKASKQGGSICIGSPSGACSEPLPVLPRNMAARRAENTAASSASAINMMIPSTVLAKLRASSSSCTCRLSMTRSGDILPVSVHGEGLEKRRRGTRFKLSIASIKFLVGGKKRPSGSGSPAASPFTVTMMRE